MQVHRVCPHVMCPMWCTGLSTLPVVGTPLRWRNAPEDGHQRGHCCRHVRGSQLKAYLIHGLGAHVPRVDVVLEQDRVQLLVLQTDDEGGQINAILSVERLRMGT
jgi:hypothetical protein